MYGEEGGGKKEREGGEEEEEKGDVGWNGWGDLDEVIFDCDFLKIVWKGRKFGGNGGGNMGKVVFVVGGM